MTKGYYDFVDESADTVLEELKGLTGRIKEKSGCAYCLGIVQSSSFAEDYVQKRFSNVSLYPFFDDLSDSSTYAKRRLDFCAMVVSHVKTKRHCLEGVYHIELEDPCFSGRVLEPLPVGGERNWSDLAMAHGLRDGFGSFGRRLEEKSQWEDLGPER
jgi:hypothetical protein